MMSFEDDKDREIFQRLKGMTLEEKRDFLMNEWSEKHGGLVEPTVVDNVQGRSKKLLNDVNDSDLAGFLNKRISLKEIESGVKQPTSELVENVRAELPLIRVMQPRMRML